MKVLELTKYKNFRDLGGLKNKDGKTIKSNCFIRGAVLSKITSKDVEILKEKYSLSTVIDLRTVREVEENPEVDLENVNYFHMPILNDSVAGLSHEKSVNSIKSLRLMPTMEKMYINMVINDSLDNVCKILKKIFELKDEELSVLFHCTAGKDRTGLIATLILLLLDVDREIVIKEYMFTNNFTMAKAKFIYLGLLVVTFNHKLANKIRQYYIAKETYIESSIKAIEDEFGSIKTFFIEKVGFSENDIILIKNRFLM